MKNKSPLFVNHFRKNKCPFFFNANKNGSKNPDIYFFGRDNMECSVQLLENSNEKHFPITSCEKINVRFFWPIFVSVKKKRTFIFSEKEGVFRPFLLALNKNRTFIVSETVHKKWRFILYMGAKIKNLTFFSVKNS